MVGPRKKIRRDRELAADSEFLENLRIVLAKDGWRRIDARAVVCKRKSSKRDPKSPINAVTGRMAMYNPARPELGVGDRFAHCAYTRGRHVVRLQ